MPARVPSSFAYGDVTMSTVLIQIIVNEGGPYFGLIPFHQIEQGLIEHTPKITLVVEVPEPTSVITVRAGGNQGRKGAVLGPLVRFMREPAGVHSGLLGIG